MTSCAKCLFNFGATAELIRCSGFCDSTFHSECTTLERSHFNAVKKNRSVLFFCDSCIELLDKSRKSIFEWNSVSAVSDSLSAFEKLSTEIATNRKLILELSENINKNSSATSQGINQWKSIAAATNFSPGPAPKRRATDDFPVVHEPPLTIRGTNPTAKSVNLISPKFWLHLSEFNVATEDVEVSTMVADCLGIQLNEVSTVKLVSKSRDVSTLKFVTFKVGFDISLKDKAMDPSVWPMNLNVRVFKDRIRNFSSKNYFRPVLKPTQPLRTQTQTIESPVSVTQTIQPPSYNLTPIISI